MAAAGGDDENGDDEHGDEDSESNEDENGESSTEESEPFSSIEFSNQYSEGSEIVVDEVVLSDSGYVAIHDGSLLQGKVTESVIGVSDYLEAGVHYSVSVTLFDVPGTEFDADALDQTQLLIPMPHRETGDNETYDFVTSGGSEDGPYVESGLPAIDAGLVVVSDCEPGSEDGSFATIDFQNQSVAEQTAVVRDVTLSEGGFVVLHDARLLQGEPFESVVGVSEYLEAGQHQAVEIEIEEPGDIAEVELPARPLIPMPHLDTNGNETYDFVTSEGSDDGPYTKAGHAVIDAGLVVVEDDADNEDDATDEEAKDGDIRLGGDTPGWEGRAPSEISGETNPTLTLEAGTEYMLVWENVDGVPHNFAIENESGEDVLASEVIEQEGATQTVTFTATAEMSEYYCQVHPSSMRGDIEIAN